MSFEGLQERLAALQETTTQLRDLIDRLADLKFQPGSVPLDANEESSDSGELSAEITQMLRGGEDEAELLLEEVEYLRPGGHDKTRLKEAAQRAASDLTSCRMAFRKARLSAKKNLILAQKLEKELVVQSYSQPVSEAASPVLGAEKSPAVFHPPRHFHQQQQQQSSLSEEDQQTVGASSNVTNALRQTHDLIAAELSRSEYAHQTLTESSAALKQLNESYGSLDTMLASSKNLLGTLLKSQKSDTWYLQTTLVLLLSTAAWLFFRRILYGPMWWLVWLPLRFIFGISSRAGSAVMQGQAGAGETPAAGNMDGRVPVEGLPKEDLPTAQVGQKASTGATKGDPDSMVDKVGKIIDGADEGDAGHDAAADQGKAQEARPKDEL